MLTESVFLQDVAKNKMTILRDEGVYRHVQFKQPGSRNMQFDLITWPGHLCYTGDMGTFVFSRSEDMFEFFRTDRMGRLPEGCTLKINRRYWAEKLLGIDRGGFEEFSEEKFKRAVMTDLVSWIRDRYHDTTKEERRSLWTAVVEDIIGAPSDSSGYFKLSAVHAFNHSVNKMLGDFDFQDFFDHDIQEYTFHFTWCCYAIAWGILQYDEAKGLSFPEEAHAA